MLTKKMERALNDQLNAELASDYLYLSMSAYFESQNLEGFANWMALQAREESQHAMKVYSYIHDRGGRVILQALDAPQSEWKSPTDAFRAAYEHEKMISGRINDLVDLANRENDHASHQFLMWFVAEQVEEEDSVRKIIDRLEMVGDSPNGMFIMDRELAKRATAPAH
jgi:ferritin